MKVTWTRRNHGWLVLAAALMTACRSAAPVAAPTPSAVPAPTPPAAAKELPLEIYWVINSAEYRALLEQTYRLAGEVLERRVAGREPGTWAVAVDADETLISNVAQSKERALGAGGSFEEVWDQWVRRREAPALPGAKAFLERVHELGGRVAVVTNRRERHCQATEENLAELEMPYDVILCRGDTGDKHPRWRSVQQGDAAPDLPALEIVMWVGDNIRDFPGLDQELRFAPPEAYSDFGDLYFVLPNPLYGSWERNPEG